MSAGLLFAAFAAYAAAACAVAACAATAIAWVVHFSCTAIAWVKKGKKGKQRAIDAHVAAMGEYQAAKRAGASLLTEEYSALLDAHSKARDALNDLVCEGAHGADLLRAEAEWNAAHSACVVYMDTHSNHTDAALSALHATALKRARLCSENDGVHHGHASPYRAPPAKERS